MMRLAALLATLLVAGCATTGGEFDAHLGSPAAQVRECAQWYVALDRAVEEAGVRDAQATRVAGFPYLRIDRPLASLRGRAASGERALQAFAERMLELDLEARRHEIENLPHASLERLPGFHAERARGHALGRTRECGRLLREIDLAKPPARQALLDRAVVPDDYSLAARAFGLYPVTRIPFAAGVRRWEAESRAAFSREPATPPGAVRIRYAPPGPAAGREVAAALLGGAALDPLGRPLLNERELEAIAVAHAPSFDIAVAGDYDRFGALRWRAGAAAPDVDAAEPVVYVQQGFTRYGEASLLQIAYSIWFAERPPQVRGDILAGHLDGVLWRVTLAPDGEPLVYDAIHPCGCYHMFFPTPRARPRPPPDALEEWAFIPQTLPRVAPGERPVVSIASGTHYIDGVSLVRGGDSLARYAFRSYDELRSLPGPGGERRSAFGPDGLIAGSERAERFLFWPMGIASAGAMRQWGRHATAFVGRRHFDDADLIERRFELDLAKTKQ